MNSTILETALRKLLPFIREHYKSWRCGTDEQIMALLCWHWVRGLVSISEDESGVQGLCIIRLISKLEDFLNPLAFDPQGQMIWIELLISTNPVAQADVHDQLERRWGPRAIVLWDRGNRTQYGAPRIFTWVQFGKLKRRMTFGLIS